MSKTQKGGHAILRIFFFFIVFVLCGKHESNPGPKTQNEKTKRREGDKGKKERKNWRFRFPDSEQRQVRGEVERVNFERLIGGKKKEKELLSWVFL